MTLALVILAVVVAVQQGLLALQARLFAASIERLLARVATAPTVVLRDEHPAPVEPQRHHISDLPFDDASWNDTVGEEVDEA